MKTSYFFAVGELYQKFSTYIRNWHSKIFNSSSFLFVCCFQQYSVETFEEYRLTISGRYQFQGPGTFTSLEGGCDDPTGCVCRTAGNIQVF